jgi:glycosyltransferase involved in cell wall biosynthesis
MVREARARGHQIDLFAQRPIHPRIYAELTALGAGFSTTGELEAAAWPALRRLRTYDVLHVNMFQPRMKLALLSYAAWPARVVLVDHTSGVNVARPTRIERALSAALDRVSLARVDMLVGVSNYVTRRDVERFGVRPPKARTIYNGVDVARFADRRRVRHGRLRIAVVAHLIAEKGVDVLLRALPLMTHDACECVIVGDGSKAGEFKALATSLKLDSRVRFLGLRDDVPDILHDADVLVHPAVWHEAFGLTIAEGMASGCAVVASRVGGIPEIIDDRRSGLLVTPGDSAALAKALDELAASPDLLNELGQRARRTVEARFSMRRCVAEHLDCMEQVAGERAILTGRFGASKRWLAANHQAIEPTR